MEDGKISFLSGGLDDRERACPCLGNSLGGVLDLQLNPAIYENPRQDNGLVQLCWHNADTRR